MPPRHRTTSTTKAESARMEESSHTTISDLPTELLHLIFEQLRIDDLYALAIQCRRLSHVALPIYLSRHNISAPIRNLSFNFGGRTTYMALPGIRLSVSAQDCFELDCSFTRGVSEIRGIRHLVSKKSKIPFINLRLNHHQLFPDSAVALEGLLNSLWENSCISLTITGGDGVGFRGYVRDVHPLTSLSVFIIRSSVLFSDLFRDWTIQSINGSALQTLELRSTEEFATVLPHLTLASLKQLHISCPRLHFNDLLAFLSRHPTITALTLTQILDNSTDMSRFPYHVLPDLTLLAGKTEYINHLFSSARPLWSLTTINILGPPNVWPGRSPVIDFPSLHRVLLHISYRKNITKVLFTLHSDEETKRWLDIRTQPKLAAKRPECFLFRVTSLHVVYVGRGVIPLIPGWLSLFPALSNVEVDTGRFGDTLDDRDAVTLVRSIADECPRVAFVGINGKFKSVAQWLAD